MSVHYDLDHASDVTEIARNAVLEQQRRLAGEFDGTTTSTHARSPIVAGPFAAMLCGILTSVGWKGKQHQILEALPHVDPVASMRTLRAVLARLEVTLVQIDRRPPNLTKEDLPCLLVGS